MVVEQSRLLAEVRVRPLVGPSSSLASISEANMSLENAQRSVSSTVVDSARAVQSAGALVRRWMRRGRPFPRDLDNQTFPYLDVRVSGQACHIAYLALTSRMAGSSGRALRKAPE